ncbi:uncharacterized protein LOC114007622 [Tupaia chinensis]|uniref:uncharacterized protein LOC114007622 n=1 Tax=Tupaia chinensis TaxID=246437 RepID=UPI000FFB72D1|nr:uncharacterized protein LOC114007622 [Tupaia chinensis]XP_027627214.1 uncharacterized protein LOC114007622 [Tupaia chinensis]
MYMCVCVCVYIVCRRACALAGEVRKHPRGREDGHAAVPSPFSQDLGREHVLAPGVFSSRRVCGSNWSVVGSSTLTLYQQLALGGGRLSAATGRPPWMVATLMSPARACVNPEAPRLARGHPAGRGAGGSSEPLWGTIYSVKLLRTLAGPRPGLRVTRKSAVEARWVLVFVHLLLPELEVTLQPLQKFPWKWSSQAHGAQPVLGFSRGFGRLAGRICHATAPECTSWTSSTQGRHLSGGPDGPGAAPTPKAGASEWLARKGSACPRVTCRAWGTSDPHPLVTPEVTQPRSTEGQAPRPHGCTAVLGFPHPRGRQTQPAGPPAPQVYVRALKAPAPTHREAPW